MTIAPSARSRALFPLIALFFCLPLQAERHQLLEIPIGSKLDRATLANLDVEIVAVKQGSVVIVAPVDGPRGPHVTRALEDVPGIRVLSEDVSKLFEQATEGDDAGAYHTYEEAIAELKGHVAARPDLCRYEPLGTSVEGREIPAIVISGPGAPKWGKPTYLFMGAHHAREWISVEVPLAIARHLVEQYDREPRVKALVDGSQIVVNPMVNPDGVHFSQTEETYWRKNRRPNGNGTFGVDPNRNYGFHWGEAGASTWPSSDTYRGPEAFSEPCTRAIRDFAIRERLSASVSYHSYGELVLWPYSYSYDTCPDDQAFNEFAHQMAALNGYHPQKSSDLYPSSGDTDDFLYHDVGALSFTIELGGSFIPDEEEIPAITTANVTAAMHLIEHGQEVFPLVIHEPPPATTSTDPIAITVKRDPAHHPLRVLESLTLVVETAEGEVETVLERDATAPDVYRGQIPAPPATGATRYFFGILETDGHKARSPWRGFHEVKSASAAPPVHQ